MKKQVIFLLLVFLGFSIISCNDKGPETTPTYAILIENNTNVGLLAYYQLNYPDTALQQYKPATSLIQQRSLGYLLSKKKWDETISENADSTIWFFFLAENTFAQYPWDSVRSNYIILKRMHFTLDSLRNLNWTVQYP
jgi:hypothetical protein